MSDMQEKFKFHEEMLQVRRSDNVFHHLLRATQNMQENEKQPLSTEAWVLAVNAKHDYTPTAIEESIEKGYVTIDEDQRVRLTDRGANWLLEFEKRSPIDKRVSQRGWVYSSRDAEHKLNSLFRKSPTKANILRFALSHLK